MKRILIAFSFAASSALLFAQEAADKIRTITVDEAVILAADNNISLKQQRLSLETLERKNKTSCIIV